MNKIKKLFSKSANVLSYKSESLGVIAFGMGVILLFTKFSGLFKLQVLAAIYSDRISQLDLFYAANMIPEFIFTIIVIGGVNAALIPVFSQTSIKESDARLKKVFSSIVNIFFFIMLFLCTLVFIFAPQIVQLSTSVRLSNTQNTFSAADYELYIHLLRILIFSPIILCVSSIFSSILQVKKHFWSTTLPPLFYNLGVIGTAFTLEYFDKDISVLAYGVLLGSLLHFLVQVPAILKAGISYELTISWKDFYVKRAMKNTAPRIISLTSDYIGNIFQVLISLNLVQGSLTAFRNAISLRDLPSSVFGLAIAQTYFPKMSELAAEGKKDELQKTFSEALRIILFWTIPITALLIVLRTPISQLIFGLFSKSPSFELTNMIAYTLLFLSFGVIFYSVLAVVIRAFFALNDSVTPTIVSIVSICFELTVTYALVNLFSHFDESLSLNPFFVFSNITNYFVNGNSPAAIGGVALASSIAILFNLTLLIIALNKKGLRFFYESRFIWKKAISGAGSLAIGLAVFRSPIASWYGLFDMEKVIGIFFITINVTVIVLGTYYFLEKIQKDPDINNFESILKKINSYFKKVKQIFKSDKIAGVGTGA